MDNHGVDRTNKPRSETQRLEDLEKIRTYRALEDEFRAAASAHDYSVPTLSLTTRLLGLNPEYYTVWNARRRCLLASVLPGSGDANGIGGDGGDNGGNNSVADNNTDSEPILRSELKFTIPLLISSPKCYWIWNHRMWTLAECVARLPRRRARALWEEELALAEKMLSRDRRNFHAWGYRRKVVARLESEDLAVDEAGETKEGTGADGAQGVMKGKKKKGQASMVEREFRYTRLMIGMDLSNFSAWHRRSMLIVRLLGEKGASAARRRKMLDDELQLVRDGLDVGPEDQSLWYYHQFLMLHVLPSSTPALRAEDSIAPALTLDERLAIARREIDAVRDLLGDYPEVKWLYEALAEYVLAVAAAREGGGRLSEDERSDVRSWVAKLRELDPMRAGRWEDLESSIENY